MSQKRVAIVLASLIGVLTLSAGMLLVMENTVAGADAAPVALAVSDGTVRSLVERPGAQLQAGRWKFIIIYESGDMAGSAASLAEGLTQGGPAAPTRRIPANFHFVVGNGAGRQVSDGAIEVGECWRKQMDGCAVIGWPLNIRNDKADTYKNAVGVCAIGSVSRAPLTDRQMNSMEQLVHELRMQCSIPARGVIFSWELAPNDRYATPAQKAFAEKFRQSMD